MAILVVLTILRQSRLPRLKIQLRDCNPYLGQMIIQRLCQDATEKSSKSNAASLFGTIEDHSFTELSTNIVGRDMLQEF